MGNLISNDRLNRKNQFFYINSTEIAGIQSISINSDSQAIPVKYLGMDKTILAPNSAQIGSININALFISNDPFLKYKGNLGFDGYIFQSRNVAATNNYSFTSGYLTSYSSRGTIGQIPEVNMTINSFGNVGKIASSDSVDITNNFAAIPTSIPSNILKIPGPGSININIDDFTTNRVLNYDLTINCQRNPIYILGQRSPYKIELVYPQEIICNFKIDVNDYSFDNIKKFPGTNRIKSLTLSVLDYNTNNTITSYSFDNMNLISETYNTNVDGNVTLDLQYKTYLSR